MADVSFCRSMLCIRGRDDAVARCPSVCPSVRHVRVFCRSKTLWQYSDGEPPNGGVEWRWGRQKSRLSTNILFYRMFNRKVLYIQLHWTVASWCHSSLVTKKRRRLFFTADDDEVFMTTSLRVTRRQQISI